MHHRVGRKNFPERIPFARRMNGRVQKRRQPFWDRSEQRQDNCKFISFELTLNSLLQTEEKAGTDEREDL